jgi:hypothetical protein
MKNQNKISLDFDSQSHETEKYGHESQQNLEPRITVLVRASSNLPN